MAQRNGTCACRSVMGQVFNCAGAWSCLRRAVIPRSLLSPPGEALWPSGPMDHGVQRRERGGGQAVGPAARPELAAPSAAAAPREIPTCSASLLFVFRSASRRLPRAVPLPVFFDAFSARPVRGYLAPGLPAVRHRNHYVSQAQPSRFAQPGVVRRPRLQPTPAPPTHYAAVRVGCVTMARVVPALAP
jgi:hypothetical protein